MEQVDKGWLSAPVPLDASGNPDGRPSSRYNVDCRFGVQHGVKLQACYDLQQSLANRCCWNRTPTLLATCDHISRLSRLMSAEGGEWRLFAADREAEYKKRPISMDGQKTAIVSLRRPPLGNGSAL